MKIGAHVSTAGGPAKGIDRAEAIGAEAVQIFATSPRAWAFKAPTEEQVLALRERVEATGIAPMFIHASYLVNVAGEPDLVSKSVESLTRTVEVAGLIGAAGVIFHGGSHKGRGFDAVLEQASAALSEVVSKCPPNVWLVIENSAGMGAHIGSSFSEIGSLIREIDSPRVMVCLDTQHTFAAGYDIVEKSGLEAALEEFDKEIGLTRLVAVHANDSKVELGAGVDRHENIGEGYLGERGFETIMAHPAFREVPFLLEVPGFDEKAKGPDKKNVDRLKAIRTNLGIS